MRTRLALFAAVFLSACGSKPEHGSAAKPSSSAPAPVQVAEARQTEWPVAYDATGTVRARNSAQISARVMAYVREVRVKTGDRVAAGQTLVVLDNRDFAVRQRQASAAHSEARSAALEADQGIESARANLELAGVTFKRMKDLYDKKSISNQEYDEAGTRLRMARANLDMAQARRNQVNARISQSEEEIKGAEIQAGYSIISAPFSGIITEKTAEPGNLAVPGAPLMTLERDGGFLLEAAVEESSLAKVKLGQRVFVTLDAVDHPVDGGVSEIVPAVDPNSRTFTAKIELPDAAGVRIGAFGRARFVTGSRQALAIPAAAVAERGQMQWVFVVENNAARARIVSLGQRNGAAVEVLSGLRTGEKIVSPVPAELADGAPVEVRP